MTNEEAITKLQNILNNDTYSWHPAHAEALEMAVDALKGADVDWISRQAAIDVLDAYQVMVENGEENPYAWARLRMCELPSAQPEQRWIPVTEKLPEEHKSIFAKFKGTDRWSEAMWEKQSDDVIVTELFEDGTTCTDTACTHDREWCVNVPIVKRKIIAWMPLPEPWKGDTQE